MRVWTVVFIIMAGFEGFDLGSSDDEAASAPDLGLFFPDDDDIVGGVLKVHIQCTTAIRTRRMNLTKTTFTKRAEP